MKKVCFLMNSVCMEERLEARMCEEAMKKSGWKVVSNTNEADTIVIYTCAVFSQREDEAMQLINTTQAQKLPHQKIIVCGCLSKINKQRLEKHFTGKSFGPKDQDALKKELEITADFEDTEYNEIKKNDTWYPLHRQIIRGLQGFHNFINKYSPIKIFPGLRFLEMINHDDAFDILVSVGCSAHCSFCAVKYSKGSVVSKVESKILDEFKNGIKKGYKNIFLCSDDLGFYGHDKGTTLADLLKKMVQIEGDYKIYLREVSPRCLQKLLPQLKEIFASGKIKAITVAVQSGSNRILELMRRGYTVEDFTHAISELKKAYPKLLLRTAIMVGFPTETETDFQHTLTLLDSVAFDMIDVYTYTNRPNTDAAKMQGQISSAIKRRRTKKIKTKAFFKMAKFLE